MPKDQSNDHKTIIIGNKETKLLDLNFEGTCSTINRSFAEESTKKNIAQFGFTMTKLC